MATYYLSPYGYDDKGFYFDSIEELEDKLAEQPSLEEYEIEFIDGDDLDALLFSAISSRESTVTAMEVIEADELDEGKKLLVAHFLDMGDNLDRALKAADNASLFEGTIEDYVYESIQDSGGLSELPPDEVERYFDWESYAKDEAINRSLSEARIAGKVYVIDPHGY